MRRGLGDMPLTLWVIVAAVVLYLYLRRARLGIDQHPGERVAVPGRPPVLPPVLILPPAPLAGQPGGPQLWPLPGEPPQGRLLQ